MGEVRKRITTVVPAQSGWVAVFATQAGRSRIEPLVGWGLAHWEDTEGRSVGSDHLVPMCMDPHIGVAFDALGEPHYLGVETAHDEEATRWIQPSKRAETWIRNRPHQTPPCDCRNAHPEICIVARGPTYALRRTCECACHPSPSRAIASGT